MPMAKTRVNWHEAAVCAVKIDLRDYAQYLEYYSEYVLGKNNYRMDLLVVKKLSCEKFPKKIAHIFSTFNIFEIKGIGSSITPDSYYKVNGYAGHFIDITGKRNQYSREDVTITFLSHSIPKKLFRHLEKMHEKYETDYRNSFTEFLSLIILQQTDIFQ